MDPNSSNNYTPVLSQSSTPQTISNSNIPQISNPPRHAPNPHPGHNFQDFLRQHRIGAILAIIVSVILFLTLIILAFRPTDDSNSLLNTKPDPENPPYLVFEHEYLINYPAQAALGSEILLNLNMIIMSPSELESAPTDNSGNKQYTATIEEDSYQTDITDTNSLYTMDINLSDGRKYHLLILVNNSYKNESAVAILDRLDTDTKDYIISFTNNTPEYYATLGTNQTSSANDSSDIFDHITGAPLIHLPDTTLDWVKTLNLTTPETVYCTLPPIR